MKYSKKIETTTIYLTSIAYTAYIKTFVPIPLKDKIPTIKDWPSVRNNPIEDYNDISKGYLPKNVRRIYKFLKSCKANNVGILTGSPSDIVVFDVDTKNNGLNTWSNTLNLNGGIPYTLTVSTPSGGIHYYFKYTEDLSNIGNINKLYGLSVDYRTNGGIIVFPGSTDKNGKYYNVLTGYIDDNLYIAEIPIWLKTLLVMDRIMKEDKQIPTIDSVVIKSKKLGIYIEN